MSPKSVDGLAFHSTDYDEISKHFKTNISTGLSYEEAENRLLQYGKNKLKDHESTHPIILFLSHFVNGMTFILIVALVISLATSQWVESVVIFIIIVSNAIIGFIQEYRSEKAINALKEITSPFARVIREGQVVQIPTTDVVVGDIVHMEMGDIVCADMRLAQVSNLLIDESLLTGESVPIEKISEVITHDVFSAGDKINLCYMSTIITKGRGIGIVIKTGMDTEIGLIADKLKKPKSKQSPMKKKLDIIAYGLFGVAIIFGIIVMWVNDWNVKDKTYLLYAITVGICTIPEGLVAVLTITMSSGVKSMTKQNALVRKISSLETLGAVTNICSDKTGTLTQAKMVVSSLWLPNHYFNVTGVGFDLRGEMKHEHNDKTVKDMKRFKRIALCASLCNTSEVKMKSEEENIKINVDESSSIDLGENIIAIGDPTEIALQVFAHKLNYDRSTLSKKGYKVIKEHEFDSNVKRMSVIVEYKRKLVGYMKGAKESVLDCCNAYIDGDEIKDLDMNILQTIDSANEAISSKGLRTIAIGYKINIDSDNSLERKDLERDFIFTGLIGIHDPPRPESKRAVEICHNAGITVHMATGDHASTAKAIARQVGILKGDEKEDSVMIASKFDSMSDEEIDALDQIPLVLARCNPDTKVKLIDALHRRKRLVAMTGDGVNDSPALHTADIGIAMGKSGSDVAKESSDIILTDDNFATIVCAVSTGRRILNNIVKIICHLVSGNVGQVSMLMIGLAIKDSNGGGIFPLSPLQALWINLATCIPPSIGLGFERQPKDTMRRPPKSAHKRLFNMELLLDIFYYGLIMGCIGVSVFLFTVYVTEDKDFGQNCNKITDESLNCTTVLRGRSVGFVTITLTLLWQAFNCKRSRKPIWRSGVFKNKFLIIATLISLAITLPLPYIPFINDRVLVMAAMTGVNWVVAIIGFLIFVCCSEVYKLLKGSFLIDIKVDMSQPLDELELKSIRS